MVEYQVMMLVPGTTGRLVPWLAKASLIDTLSHRYFITK